MKIPRFFNKLIDNAKYTETCIDKKFYSKEYGEKVILRNSIKSNFEMLTISIVLVIITLYINTIYKNTILSIVFCIIIVLIPLLKIVNQKAKLIISKESIIFSNGKQVKWREIKETKIEKTNPSELNSYFKLNIIQANNKLHKIIINDLNYSISEISHIIEYYKEKNGC
jgi:hypothetical protein